MERERVGGRRGGAGWGEADMTPILEACSISKRFGGVVALDQVSLAVRAGELLSVCGENGAGKSTLMKILCGQYTEYEGELRLRGEPVRFAGIRDAENRGISIIHQELNLVEQLSVTANLFVGREMRRWGFLETAAMRRKAREVLERLECRIDPDTLAGHLRVGDQQLIEIAKAITIGSDILIMDEPTSALTEAESARLDRVIADLRSSGVTVLYISHKMEEVFRLSDRIAILRDGRNVGLVEQGELTPRELTHRMVGREFAALESPAKNGRGADRSSGTPRLRVRNLWRKWPDHPRQWRLKDISFEAWPGEIVGFAGLMGAGRTELFECLYGQSNDETGGLIELDGKAVRFRHAAEALSAGVAMVTEDRKRLGLFQNLDVGRNITLSSLAADCNRIGMISSAREQRRGQSVVEQLRVKTDGLKVPIGSLSGGNQQKCVIGRALQTGPRVLLLDDPTRGIDVGAKAEICRLMRELAAAGLLILMASGELPELLTVCDRILVLCEGRITGEFLAAEATEQKIMEAAVALQQSAS